MGGHQGSFLDRKAQNIGKRVNLRIQVGNYENVCQMAAVGVGIAIVPRAIALSHAKSSGLCMIPLEDPWARRQISLVKQQQRMLPKFSEDLIHHLKLAASQAPTSAIKPA